MREGVEIWSKERSKEDILELINSRAWLHGNSAAASRRNSLFPVLRAGTSSRPLAGQQGWCMVRCIGVVH